MRVIAGTARSLPLSIPQGEDVRPTIDRYKETLFNIISPYIPGAKFLDIFSGSGAIGIEALSRGAKEAVFVESAGKAMACIEHNLNFTKLFEKAVLMKYDYIKALIMLGDRGQKFDVIYMDPPFEKGLERKTLELVLEAGLLDSQGIMVIESHINTDLGFLADMPELTVYKSKEFKTCAFTFIRLT